MANHERADVGAVCRNWIASDLVLGSGFFLTGVGTVVLGVLLPVFSKAWGLRDDTAGLLFFLQFLGSSLGAVLSSANRIRSLLRGYALLVVTTCALAFVNSRISFGIFFFYGLGLGLVMTSTSLIFSDRYGDGRAVKLEALNFAWAAGATVAPILLLPFLLTENIRSFFLALQGLFLSFLVWVLIRERRDASPTTSNELLLVECKPRGALIPLILMAICAVGIDSSLSGWLTTYSHRADALNVGSATLTTSVFWLGLTLSRLAFSTRLLAMIGRHRVLALLLWALAGSIALLISARLPSVILMSAALSGLCVGPIYPLLLSYMLETSPRGWIFGVSGTGAVLLPWLTGLLSAHFGSLRYGLLVPCGAAMVMVTLRSTSLRLSESELASTTSAF
jgi:FHS family glucose/mannose:H+ symporter-like MFS transporter